jgi:predicted nucleic acid-binding protein
MMAIDLRKKMLLRGDQLLTSKLTLGEVLVKPMSVGDMNLCRKYEKAIAATSLIIPFDLEAARGYAALRSGRSLRAPDAMQLACAAAAHVDLFVTNDCRLQGKHVTGIEFIVALEKAPL